MLRFKELTAKVSGSQRFHQPVEIDFVMRIEVDHGAEPRGAIVTGLDPQPERIRGLQSVHDVQVVSPAFGEVLPRVGSGIGADELLLPILSRTPIVVPPQGFGIVLALVSEDRRKSSIPGLSRTSTVQ